MVGPIAAQGILTALRTALGGGATGTIASKLIPGKTEIPVDDNKQLLDDAVEAVSETRKLNEDAQSSIEPGLNLFEQIKGILESIKEDTSTVIKEMNADEDREIKAAEKAESMRVEKKTEDARKPFLQSAKEVTNSVVQGVKSGISGLKILYNWLKLS